MTTPRTRSLVSFAISLTLAVTLAVTLAGCGGARPRQAADRPAPSDESALAIRFDNEAGDYARVYLVSARRQWLLGRVEAGGRATLPIPENALAANDGWMRIAVLVGGPVSARAVDDPRAAVAMAQPTTTILSQRWTLARSVSSVLLTTAPRVPPAR